MTYADDHNVAWLDDLVNRRDCCARWLAVGEARMVVPVRRLVVIASDRGAFVGFF